MSECKHPAYSLVDGVLVCASCAEPSPSPEWPENVHGAKAIEQETTENKGRFWPAESKRIGRPRKAP